MMNSKWSSRPRPVRLVQKVTGKTFEFDSVAAAGRFLGKSAHNMHAILSGNAGKRCGYRAEYMDGKPSRAVAGAGI